jgi:hypothetical protein
MSWGIPSQISKNVWGMPPLKAGWPPNVALAPRRRPRGFRPSALVDHMVPHDAWASRLRQPITRSPWFGRSRMRTGPELALR